MHCRRPVLYYLSLCVDILMGLLIKLLSDSDEHISNFHSKIGYDLLSIWPVTERNREWNQYINYFYEYTSLQALFLDTADTVIRDDAEICVVRD